MKSWKGWKGWGRESWKAKGEILMLVGIEENHPQHHHGGHDNDEMIHMTMMVRWMEGGSSHNHDHGVPNLMIMTMMVRWVMMMRMMMMMR